MIHALLALCLFTAASETALAANALTQKQINRQMAICDSFGADLLNANECYYTLAQNLNDPRYCDHIRSSARATSCRRNIIFMDELSFQGVIHQSVFVVFFMLLLGCIIFVPPRSPYLVGAMFGTLIVFFTWWVDQTHYEWPKIFVPHIPVILSPTAGILNYSPSFLEGFSLWSRQILSHILLYGLVLGLMLQGGKKFAIRALLIFLSALMFSYIKHPSIQHIISQLPWF